MFSTILNENNKCLCPKNVVKQGITYQNLNSGSLRINGLNSSSDLVGKAGPSSKEATQND